MTQFPVDRVFASRCVEDWDLPADAKEALQTVGLPKMVGSWKAAWIQESKDPILRFEGVDPLYEIVRKVSLWSRGRAYCCFGAEARTGRVFRAHLKLPSDQVDSETTFGVPRLVNTSVPAFLKALDLEAKQYSELFGVPSAEDLAEIPDSADPDDEFLWSVSEKYFWQIRAVDPVAFDDPEGYWRSLYYETWEQVGSPPFRLGSTPFDG
ncbi:SUKH-4 family immunity protein [Streptomyces canus]|uniref:SUKH-4 family immunity protein n=1 Tax=Streptomyces canus TaxID=58343 RepID=UPI00386EAC31|nr:SUKH-4 family immunity protein [Streptomyces canus]